MKPYTHYTKLVLILALMLAIFTRSYAQEPDNLLLEMLENVPQTAAFPQMNAMTISYANYRAIERANGVPNLTDRDDYSGMDATIRDWWQLSLLRVHAGQPSFTNLTQEKIENMPELVGFDFFDVDQALVYGADPFVGTIYRSETDAFDTRQVRGALRVRDFEPMVVATGTAWGKGGDGQTDVDNIVLGDPFGGDVGLASRVAVFKPSIVANAFLWAIVQEAAKTSAGETPSYADLPAYQLMAEALQSEAGELLQTFILNTDAGVLQQTNDKVETLPPYTLAATADLQVAEDQVHRVVLIYNTEADAEAAAALLPDLIQQFDNGWLQTIGFTDGDPTIDMSGDFYVVTYDLTAPAPSPQESLNGAFEPALVFGFWATAIRQGNFYPLAIPEQESDNTAS